LAASEFTPGLHKSMPSKERLEK